MIYLVAEYVRCSGYGYDEMTHEIAQSYTAIELDTIVSDTQQLYRDGACECYVVSEEYLTDFGLAPPAKVDPVEYRGADYGLD